MPLLYCLSTLLVILIMPLSSARLTYTLSLHDALPICLRTAGDRHLASPHQLLDPHRAEQLDERLELLRPMGIQRSEEHTSELQSLRHLVCRILLEKKKTTTSHGAIHTYTNTSIKRLCL